MSAPATALTQRNIQILTDTNNESFAAALHECIARRAYEIFENAGRPAGEDQPHWFKAESEVLQHGSPIRESGSWSTANATLPGADAADVQVLLQSDRAILSCSKPAQCYVVFRFPVSVDPQTAAAYMKGDTFVLTAKHSSYHSPSLSHSPSNVAPTTPQSRSVTAPGAAANDSSASAATPKTASPTPATAPLNQKSETKAKSGKS
jgi:hypothetical protein